jgi:hypothetical protein
MNERWSTGDYLMLAVNTGFTTVMAILLFPQADLAARIFGFVFALLATYLWAAVLSLLHDWRLQRRRHRENALRRRLMSKPPCMTFCHNPGMPFQDEEERE